MIICNHTMIICNYTIIICNHTMIICNHTVIICNHTMIICRLILLLLAYLKYISTFKPDTFGAFTVPVTKCLMASISIGAGIVLKLIKYHNNNNNNNNNNNIIIVTDTQCIVATFTYVINMYISASKT